MTSHTITTMKSEISISEFKATCLAIIEEVKTTGKSIIVTKNGVPAVRIIPAPQKKSGRDRLFGALKSDVLKAADILNPLGMGEWDVFK